MMQGLFESIQGETGIDDPGNPRANYPVSESVDIEGSCLCCAPAFFEKFVPEGAGPAPH